MTKRKAARRIAWVLLGILIGAVSAVAFVSQRIQALSAVDFEIIAPPVPFVVIEAVRGAEHGFYAKQSRTRRLIEEAQDIGAFLSPKLVYEMNFSVGPFRLRGHTLAATIPWAIDEGYLILQDAQVQDFHWLYVYLAEQPGLAEWGAAVHLEHLRRRHPLMQELGWSQIAADPSLIAKVYSGYLGAGGDWDKWAADLVPGSVAKDRMRASRPPMAGTH